MLQVRSILSLVAELGREWVPTRMVVSGSFIELSNGELDQVAAAEHTRWYQRQLDFRRSNELAAPWENLSSKSRLTAREQLRTQIAQLEKAGFMPTIPVNGPPQARSFERVGIVSAKRLSTPFRWALGSGEQMRGDAGDWHVADDRGHVRTVTDREFRASHQSVGGGRWRRVGIFRAWLASETLVIRTKEGRSTAVSGDWVVEGPAGERWAVSDKQFQCTYRPVTDDAADSVSVALGSGDASGHAR
jgi:hypothetical protein